MKNVAVILAGGSGTRIGGDVPKQFMEWRGRKIIEFSLETFNAHPDIDEICIVVHKDYIDLVRRIVLSKNFNKVTKICEGGKERYHSSLAAIKEFNHEVNLIFHDAARPMITSKIISDVIEALKNNKAVATAIQTTDTIFIVNENNEIVAIPYRNNLRNAQTPQAFRRSVIAEAYSIAMQDPMLTATDDCGIVLKYLPTQKITVVPGDVNNIKITYKEDLE